MEMLLICLLVWMILMILSWRRYKAIFNPYTLESYFVVFFMILPQLGMYALNPNAKFSFYSDLVILVYLVSIYIGTRIRVKTSAITGVKNVKVVNVVNALLYAALLIPIIPFFLSAPSIRSFYETVVFTKYASFFDLSKVVLYFLIFFKLVRREKFSLGFFLLFPLVFLYGSRFVILDAVVYLCVFLEQFRELPVRKLVIVGSIGIAAIGIFTYTQFQSIRLEEMFVSYFDIYRNQSFLVESLIAGKIDYYYGEIYVSSYLKYIPRILWENKPKAFGFAILNYDIFPEKAQQGYMPSFGLGTAFADFGFLSVILIGLTSGLIKDFLYRTFIVSRNNVSFFLYVFPLSFITMSLILLYLFIDRIVIWLGQYALAGRSSLNSQSGE